MNCTNCNQPLEPQARFCRSCGFPVPTSTATNNPSLAQRNQPPFNYDVPTRATTSGSTPPAPQPPSQPWTAPQQPGFQQPTVPVSMPSNGAQAFPAKEVTPPRPRRRRGRRVLLGCLTSFIIALLVFGAAWFVILRPYLHNMATDQINQALTIAINHIPLQVSQAPAGPLPVRESVINNLIVLNTAPDDPVKNVKAHLTTSGISIEFQVLNFTSSITAVPQAVGGKLVVSQVSVNGIAALIMSPDEVTTLMNNRLADAQQRLGRTITDVILKDQELDLVLGPPGSSPGGLPGGITPPALP